MVEYPTLCVPTINVSRYILEEYTKAWAVPSSPAVNPSSEVPPTSSPTPMETDSAGQQDDEDLAASSAAAKGWKGKGKQRAGSARRNVVTTGTQVSRIPLKYVARQTVVKLLLYNSRECSQAP